MELASVKDENRDKTKEDFGLLVYYEERWVQLYYFLRQRGYRLRPRYDPEWVPSWRLNPVKGGSYYNEDSIQGVSPRRNYVFYWR